MGFKHDMKDFASGIFFSIALFPIVLLFAFEDFNRDKRLKKFLKKGGNVMENDNK